MSEQKWKYIFKDWPQYVCPKCKVYRYAIGQNDLEWLLSCDHTTPKLYDPDSLEGIQAEADIVRATVYEIFSEEDPVIKEKDL